MDETLPPLYRPLLTAAEAVIRDRPEVDADMVREIFREVVTTLHNSLVLDDLDEHDAAAVIDALCTDLVAPDPGAAVRERSRLVAEQPGDLHDPATVSAAHLVIVRLLQL